eukprot:2892006-Rhodomonas_salina.1
MESLCGTKKRWRINVTLSMRLLVLVPGNTTWGSRTNSNNSILAGTNAQMHVIPNFDYRLQEEQKNLFLRPFQFQIGQVPRVVARGVPKFRADYQNEKLQRLQCPVIVMSGILCKM